MQSRAWSTEELSSGLEHLLTDGRLELPDDVEQLKDAHRWNIETPCPILNLWALWTSVVLD